MSPVLAHGICFCLTMLDLVVRALRTRLFLVALRHPLPFREVFIHGTMGEAASSLTPLRVGGEPARAWAMIRSGVPSAAAIVCVGIELLATLPVIIVAAIVLGIALAPEWWSVVGPGLVRGLADKWIWIALAFAVAGAAWIITERAIPGPAGAIRREIKDARAHASELPAWVYAANVPLTLAQIAARVAILPVLALTLPTPPPVDATVLGSFVLLYSQALMPTPAGAGAVDVGFVEGAAGELGVEAVEILVVWRIYTTLIGLFLGSGFALYRYGWTAITDPIRTGLMRADRRGAQND